MASRLGIGFRQYQNYEQGVYDVDSEEDISAATHALLKKAQAEVDKEKAMLLSVIPTDQTGDVAEKIIRLEAEAERLEQYIANIRKGIGELKNAVTGRQSSQT